MARVRIDEIETDMMPAMYSFSSDDGGDHMIVVRHLGMSDAEWARTVADMAKNGYFLDAEQPGNDDASRREALERVIAAHTAKP